MIEEPVSLVPPPSIPTVYVTSAPPSAPSVGVPIEIVAVLLSLSLMRAVALFVPIAPTLGFEIVAIIVSCISSSMSSVTANVIIAELAPSEIEKLVTAV